MVDILSCLTSKNCVADDLKLISDGTLPGYWKGAYDGITYLCTQDGRTGNLKHRWIKKNHLTTQSDSPSSVCHDSSFSDISQPLLYLCK